MNKAIIALAALAVTGTAVAGPSWTYVDAGYTVFSSVGDDESDGFNLSGSFGFAEKWHVGADYFDGEIEGGKGSGSGGADIDGFSVTIGGHPALTDSTDLVGEISYFDGDIDVAGGSGSTDGYALTVGVRSMFTDTVELSGGISAVNGDIEGVDYTDIQVQVGGQYMANDNIGIGVDLVNSDDNSANFYVRWSF